MYGAILLQYRFCIVTTTPQLIAKISWRYLHKRISYRHHFDVVTMTMIFQKNSIFLQISILHRHDNATTYREDIVIAKISWWYLHKEYHISIISMLLLWRLLQKLLKFSNDSISQYCYDIISTSFHYSIEMTLQRYCSNIEMILKKHR